MKTLQDIFRSDSTSRDIIKAVWDVIPATGPEIKRQDGTAFRSCTPEERAARFEIYCKLAKQALNLNVDVNDDLQVTKAVNALWCWNDKVTLTEIRLVVEEAGV